jgi:hypothetical protein
MIRNVSIALAAAFAVGLWALPNVVSAQEENQKRENVDYFQIIHLNFKPGHNTDAWAILYTKIGPAVRSTGREFIALDWESGPWDSSIYIRLDDGYGTLDYAATPQFLEFRAALAEAEGGEEAGDKLWDEWTSHIDDSSRAVAHMHLPPTDDE